MKAAGKTSFAGVSLALPATVPRSAPSPSLVTGVGVGVWLTAEAAQAAYGDPVNVLGKTTDTSGFIPYVGEGFALKLPSRWNPSREREFAGVVVRYEDNGDAVTNFLAITRDTDKKSISDYGSEEDFLKTTIAPLLGQQVLAGETMSEGGFKPGVVQSASLLEKSQTADKNGENYYTYNILTRSADGDEGGRHQLSATVSNGKLFILKAQCGDKRWFKGIKTDVQGLVDSFIVA